MKTARIIFEDGNVITTDINGTDKEIKEYYSIGRFFNFGVNGDNMVKVTKCTILKQTHYSKDKSIFQI